MLSARDHEVTRKMAKVHRTEWKIFDWLKFIFCIEKIEFYFTLKNRNYYLVNPITQIYHFHPSENVHFQYYNKKYIIIPEIQIIQLKYTEKYNYIVKREPKTQHPTFIDKK